jgi:hypothetical protein
MGAGYRMHAGRHKLAYNAQYELSADEQKEMLINQKAIIESELSALQKKLDEL